MWVCDAYVSMCWAASLRLTCSKELGENILSVSVAIEILLKFRKNSFWSYLAVTWVTIKVWVKMSCLIEAEFGYLFGCSNTPFWSKIEHCDLVFKWRKLRIFCCIGESIFCQHLFKINTRRIKNVSFFWPGANKIMQNLKKNWVVCSFKTFSVFCH